MAKLLSRLPERLHHLAHVVKDQEANRRFFEDLLGLPLTATWCERHFSPWVNREVSFCHTFYSLADGGALAFFSFADEEVYQKCQAEAPPQIRNFSHVAFKVDDTDLRRDRAAADGWRMNRFARLITAIAGRCIARPQMD